jgi:hypothetical protein
LVLVSSHLNMLLIPSLELLVILVWLGQVKAGLVILRLFSFFFFLFF